MIIFIIITAVLFRETTFICTKCHLKRTYNWISRMIKVGL